MRQISLQIFSIILFLLAWQLSMAQEKEPLADKIINFPTSFLNKVQNKYANLEDRLTKQTEKYLVRLAKREKRLKKKLAKVDSAAAEQTLAILMRNTIKCWQQ